MSDQYNEFSEKTKHIEIAMKYTGGDMDKSKAMVSGHYFDIAVLKAKFFAPGVGHSGVFLAFFNTVNEYISGISAVISLNRDIYENTRVFDDWKLINNDLNASREIGTTVNADALCDFLMDSFIENDIFPDVKDGNIDSLTRGVRQILERSFNGKIQIQLETEPANSLQLELSGVNIDNPDKAAVQQAYEQAPQDDDELLLTPEEEKMNRIEAEAKYVIEGKIIVAPVKGKYINDVTVGDNLKLLLSSKDPVSLKILKVLNAIDEDKNISAIKGRVKEKIPYPGGGYVIYALVAKGVLAKVIEEENVKIQLEQPQQEQAAKQQQGDGKYVLIMAMFAALIIILIIILLKLS